MRLHLRLRSRREAWNDASGASDGGRTVGRGDLAPGGSPWTQVSGITPFRWLRRGCVGKPSSGLKAAGVSSALISPPRRPIASTHREKVKRARTTSKTGAELVNDNDDEKAPEERTPEAASAPQHPPQHTHVGSVRRRNHAGVGPLIAGSGRPTHLTRPSRDAGHSIPSASPSGVVGSSEALFASLGGAGGDDVSGFGRRMEPGKTDTVWEARTR
ncbi:hypothetical protein VUR80DRAFT_5508 [Thermomyces stellatus]